MMCPHDVSQRPAQLFHWLITQPSATLASIHRVTYPTQLSICIIRLFWTQIILYRLCCCLDNISSSSLHLTTAYCSWLFHHQMRRFVPEIPHVCLPRGRKFLLRKSTCPAPNVPAKRPQVATSQIRSVPVIVTTSIVSVYFIASLWCSFLLLRAWTAIWYHTSSRDWTPLLHGYCLVAQAPAQLSSLLPPGATLINILLLFLFIIV